MGEKTSYRMEFMGLPAGTLDFNVLEIVAIDSVKSHHLIVKARTNTLFSPLFGINNTYESYFSTNTFLPLKIQKTITQKNINQRLIIHFNHSQNIASISDSIFWSIPDSCFGFFSMIYYLRNQKFITGESIRFYLDSENLSSQCIATVGDDETISVPAGKFNVIEVNLRFKQLSTEPRPWKTDLLTNRMANPDSRVTIWFRDDSDRLPVKFQFKQKGFNIKLILTEFQ